MSARQRATADEKRRAAWARRIAADQRREAQRAAATQRSIARLIESIRTASRPKPASVGSLRRSGVVTAILPNGRRTRMRIIPTLAPISDLNRLAAAMADAVKKLTAARIESDKNLRKRLVEAESLLNRRITKKVSGK